MGLGIEEFKLKPVYGRETDKPDISSVKKELNEIKTLLRQVIEQVRQGTEQNQLINQQSVQSTNQLITEEFSRIRLDLVKLSDEFKEGSGSVNLWFRSLNDMEKMIERNNQRSDSFRSEIDKVKEMIKGVINQSVVRPREEKAGRIEMEKTNGMPDRLTRVMQAFEKCGIEWVTYEQLGASSEPPLTKDGIRGYISELVNGFSAKIEKKKIGKQIFIRLIRSD